MITIGITLGDPVGVGPEVLIKSFPIIENLKAKFVLFGDKNLVENLARKFSQKIPKNLEILDLSDVGNIIPGKPNAITNKAIITYLNEAIKALKERSILGLVTLPINKSAFQECGLSERGHTEFLAKHLGAKGYAMSFYGKRLRIALLTTHIPLRDVSKSLKKEKFFEVLELVYDFLKKSKPQSKNYKIALCGLNPHAGEEGLLGDEEERIIKPWVEEAIEKGIPIFGPLPADSLFYNAKRGEFDFIIALYHDQGLIPFKMLHFLDGVNLTLGLPVVRTSPVHGTAYDIAGKGVAHPGSFQAALKLTLKLAKKW